jgi:hypothetical protein
MKNKIVLLLITSLCICKSFSIHSSVEDVGPYHGAGVLFTAGVLRGLDIFSNVTHKNECLSILPIIHDDWVEVSSKFHNATNYKEILEALKFTITIFEKLEQDVNKVRPDCKTMCSDIDQVIKNIKSHLMKKERLKLTLTHVFNNLGIIMGKYEMSKEELRAKHFYQGGVYFGRLLNFIILWDF